jgi:hypothetical protein
VRGHLLLTNCIEDEVTRPNIELALKEDKLLWLDLQDTDDETLALLREVFKLHPLAVEDAKEFNQRPKVEDYDNFVSLVAYGARGPDEPLVEVHCFYAEKFLVSVHRDEAPAIVVPDRVLRPELRLAGEPDRVARRLHRHRHRHRGGGRRRPGHAVPHPGLDGPGQVLKIYLTERSWCLPWHPRSPLRAGTIGTDSLSCEA